MQAEFFKNIFLRLLQQLHIQYMLFSQVKALYTKHIVVGTNYAFTICTANESGSYNPISLFLKKIKWMNKYLTNVHSFNVVRSQMWLYKFAST